MQHIKLHLHLKRFPNKMTTKYDSIIFDMDGTLWDAVDSYCKIWDKTFEQMGYSQTVSREELLKCMGMPINEIFQQVVKVDVDSAAYLELLEENYTPV